MLQNTSFAVGNPTIHGFINNYTVPRVTKEGKFIYASADEQTAEMANEIGDVTIFIPSETVPDNYVKVVLSAEAIKYLYEKIRSIEQEQPTPERIEFLG